MLALEGMPARPTDAVMRSSRACAVTGPVAMIAPWVMIAGGNPVMPVVAPGERPTLPLVILVPTTPVLVIAVPPRMVKLPAESRMDCARPGPGTQRIAASTARDRRTERGLIIAASIQ